MSNAIRILILPGRGNSGDKHWQTVWERRNPDLIRVHQREWQNPDCNEWVWALHTAIVADTTPVILVAHSLAVSLVAHWASQHHGPVKAALLVAPSDVEDPDYPAGTSHFAPIPLIELPFETVVVASDNDPRARLERATLFARSWGAQLQIVTGGGHLGSEADLGDWAFGARILNNLLFDEGHAGAPEIGSAHGRSSSARS